MDYFELTQQDSEMTKRSSATKTSRAKQRIRVIELFAGVGGFRLGLEGKTVAQRKASKFETVWANQWEPSTRKQHAADVYRARFPDANNYRHFNCDINTVVRYYLDDIPQHDLLCGGFPCQDYSVARPRNSSGGIKGKKGVLWWSIYDIVYELPEILGALKRKPRYLLLENVDRLLKSPSKQRGRDFAIILASLANIGYAVEWRVVNSGEYGFSQRRKRVFMLAYYKDTQLYRQIGSTKNLSDWILSTGVLARALPVVSAGDSVLFPRLALEQPDEKDDQSNVFSISRKFNRGNKLGDPFRNSGVMFDYGVWTFSTREAFRGKRNVLGDVLVSDDEVPEEYWISKSEIEAPRGWRYCKGAKSEMRTKKNGVKYSYDEGPIAFPDHLDRPSRTIITSEGGRSPNRTKHVIKTKGGYRRLLPIELERLNGFPDNHTSMEGMKNSRRAFFMGNALVVGVVQRIGKELARRIVESRRRRSRA